MSRGDNHAHVSGFGAEAVADGRFRFRLWAPDRKRVSLLLDDDEFEMRRNDRGWFEFEHNCRGGSTYRYRLHGEGTHATLDVPDPASRFQPEGVDGPSAVVDPRAFSWRHGDWRGNPWHQTVLYEAHVGLMGGYAGVQAQLPRLAALGITALQLMPLAQCPGRRNWGYDGVLPYAPSNAYGSVEQLKSLIDAAHGMGLSVLLDVVYNHFGPEGNLLAQYASGFFDGDTHTPWGAAIDFRRPEVREYFIQNALYWLHELRFDGLRLDAVHAIIERDWLLELAARVRESVEPGRHVHLVLENDDNDAGLLREGFDAQWNDDIHHVLHVLLTGESEGYYGDYADAPARHLARALGQGFVYQGEPSAHRGGKRRGSDSVGLGPTAFVAFVQNHDQIGNRAFGDRLTRIGRPELLPVAHALLLLSPQIPMLFMGEEVAATEPFLYFTDYRGELADAVREGRRREFAGFAAFADATARQSIPDPNDPLAWERSRPDFHSDAAEALSQRARVQSLLEIRHREIVPGLENATALDARPLGDAGVSARWRLGEGRLLQIDANFGAVPVAAAWPLPPAARVLFQHPVADVDREPSAEQSRSLPPASIRVVLAPLP